MTRTAPTTVTHPLRRTALPLPTAADVVDLQTTRGYPSVSVLLTTQAGPRMTLTDATRLEAVLAEACGRLDQELGHVVAAAFKKTLYALADDAAGRPAGAGVALFAGPGGSSAWRLPVAVQDRAVVDPTFATRDLVRGLHQSPNHVVLVLTERDARLFVGSGDSLRPVPGQFPLPNQARQTGPGQADGTSGKGQLGGADNDAFFRTVDRALDCHLRQHPAPFVVVGAQRTVSSFLRVARTTSRLAGIVAGSHAHTSLPVLVGLVRPAVEHYLRFRQEQSLDLLERRWSRGRAVAGMTSVWLAANVERPEMLAVEIGLVYPARLSSNGTSITAADDVTHPEVIDDAVDELIELVLERQGWVAFVDDGALAAYERVALTLQLP